MKPGARSILGRRLVALVGTALLLTGCEWGLGIGTGFHDAELRGSYEGTFRIEWSDRRGGGRDEGPGTIRLRRGFGSSFDGEWRWRLGARRLGGDVRRGRASFGDLSFALETSGRRDLLEALTDCRFVSGDRLFRGRIQGRSLRASRTARLRCRDLRTGRSEELRVRLSFRGWR